MGEKVMCNYCGEHEKFIFTKDDLVFSNYFPRPKEPIDFPDLGLSYIDEIDIYTLSLNTRDGLYSKKISYCPMCGRKLGD